MLRGGKGQGMWGNKGSNLLQFVQVVVQCRDTLLETLAFTCFCHNHRRLGGDLEGISGEGLPVVEHTLREGLATSIGAQISRETLEEKILISIMAKNILQHYNKAKWRRKGFFFFFFSLVWNSVLTERLVYRQVSLDHKHGCSRDLGLVKHMPTFPVQHTIDATNHLLRALERGNNK